MRRGNPNIVRRIAKGVMIATTVAVGLCGSAQAVERGGSMTASLFLEPVSLDPLLVNAPPADFPVLRLLYDTLVTFSPDGEIAPGIAKSYEFSKDYLSVTFTLRQGVKFHDGNPVDAEAVAYNLQRVTHGKVKTIFSSTYKPIDSVEVTGPYTVRVNLKTPSSTFMDDMAGIPGMIVSPTAVDSLGDDFGVNPVGSGPFKFEARQGGSSLTLARNGDYWRMGEDDKALPYLDNVTFRWILEPSVKIIELTSGNVHLVDRLDSADFDRVAKDPNLKLVDTGGINQWVALNISKKPFDDVRVRKAIYYALDRETIATIISGKYWQITPTFVFPTEFAYDGTIDPYTFDKKRAKELLAEAGFGPGHPLSFDLSIIQREPDVSVAQIIQAQLKEIGVDMQLSVLERQAFIDLWRKNAHQSIMGGLAEPAPEQHVLPVLRPQFAATRRRGGSRRIRPDGQDRRDRRSGRAAPTLRGCAKDPSGSRRLHMGLHARGEERP